MDLDARVDVIRDGSFYFRCADEMNLVFVAKKVHKLDGDGLRPPEMIQALDSPEQFAHGGIIPLPNYPWVAFLMKEEPNRFLTMVE